VHAQEEARTLGHDHIGTEHLLLGVLREADGLGVQVLAGLGIKLDDVRARAVELVGSTGSRTEGQIPFTGGAKKTLEVALREALTLGHNYIGTEHLLLALTDVTEEAAAGILRDAGASGDRIRADVIGRVSALEGEPPSPPVGRMGAGRFRSGPGPEVRRLLLGAAACAREDGRSRAGFDDILIALTREPAAANLLAALGIDEAKVRRAAGRAQPGEAPS
jgi:ATP-dependent Clp protease ATP-binding subunit ClpC